MAHFICNKKISWSHKYLLHFKVPYGNVFYLQFTRFLLFSNFNYYHNHLLLEYSNSCLSYKIRKEAECLQPLQRTRPHCPASTPESSGPLVAPVPGYLTTSVVSVRILMHMTRRKMCTRRYIAQVCKKKFQFEKKNLKFSLVWH